GVPGRPAVPLDTGATTAPLLPTTFYVPGEGPILVGEPAEKMALRDPAGVVRYLKHSLHRTDPLLRNRRRIGVWDLAALLFAHVRERSRRSMEQGGAPQCVLPIPPSFDRQQAAALKKSAEL